MSDKIKVGTVTGLGAAINVSVGFIPTYVKVFNPNDAGSLWPVIERWSGMAAASGLKSLKVVDNGATGNAANAYITSNGLSDYAGAAPNADLSATNSVATTKGSATITGSGSKFLTDLRVGDIIRSDFNGETLQIAAIASDTSATATTVAENTASGKTFKRINGREPGFTIGADTDLNVASEVMFYIAVG